MQRRRARQPVGGVRTRYPVEPHALRPNRPRIFSGPAPSQDPLAEAPEDGTVVNVTHVVTSTQLLQGVFRAAYSLLTAPKHTSLSLMASLDY